MLRKDKRPTRIYPDTRLQDTAPHQQNEDQRSQREQTNQQDSHVHTAPNG